VVNGQCHASAALYHRGRAPDTHWIGDWVGLRAGLDTEVTGKIRCLCRGSNPDRSSCPQSDTILTVLPGSLNMNNKGKRHIKLHKTFPMLGLHDFTLIKCESCIQNFSRIGLNVTRGWTLWLKHVVELHIPTSISKLVNIHV
jgi:hypothetical protein